MAKLVEEVVISSDVLVDVLVQVGFLDKAFVDGNVSRIDSSYYRDGVNTYSITVEKEVSLDSVKGGDSKELVGTDDVGRPIYKEKKQDAPRFISPLEFAVNLITNLNEQVELEQDTYEKRKQMMEYDMNEFRKRINKAKGSI